MKISNTGNGLNILITCDYLPHHSWMSFICWYSISKNLPDASVFVVSNRRLMNCDLFSWARKVKIPLFLHPNTDIEGQIEIALKNGVEKPLLVIPPESICVRDFDEAGYSTDLIYDIKRLDDDLFCNCKENRSCVFAIYPDGWGKFVTSSWINKMSCPFRSAAKYNQTILTANEARIGRIWKSATPLFQTVSRG